MVSAPGTGISTRGTLSATTLKRDPHAVTAERRARRGRRGGAGSCPIRAARTRRRIRFRPPAASPRAPPAHIADASGAVAVPLVSSRVPAGTQHRVAGDRNRLVLEPEVPRVARGDRERAEEDRQAHAHRDGVRTHRLPLVTRAKRSPSSGGVTNRARPSESSASGVGRHRSPGARSQRIAWRRPIASTSSATALAAIHDLRGRAEPHRRDRHLPRPPRIPECRRRAAHRAGCAERGEAEPEQPDPGGKPPPGAPGERLRPPRVLAPPRRVARVSSARPRRASLVPAAGVSSSATSAPRAPRAAFLQRARDRRQPEREIVPPRQRGHRGPGRESAAAQAASTHHGASST